MNRRLALVVVIGFLVALPACGNSNKVGSKSLSEFKDQGGEGALGNTTSTKPAPTTVAVATTATPTTRPVPTTAAAKPSIEIKIQGDTQGNAFDPSNARVFVGSIVRWTNRDTIPHSVQGRKKEFDSGPIAPGKSWDYTATRIGSFEYTDVVANRTYAIGYLEVLAR